MTAKSKEKMVRVEVRPTHASPYGTVAEIVPGKSIRIVGWKPAEGVDHAAVKTDKFVADMLATDVSVSGIAAVLRDYLLERGLLVQAFDRTFLVGDEIEFDSYNLSYTAPILSITAKSVIVNGHGPGKTHMKLDSFTWRNWDFNAAETRARNAETMNYL
jgi:hypothetical protein